MRSIGSMNLNFGLVNVPVKMYPATSSHDAEFHGYHVHDDGSAARINQVVRCAGCHEEVRRSELAKGVEREDQVILLSAEELADAEIEAGKDLEILLFCGADEIDPIMLDSPYFLEPNTRQASSAVDGYVMLRDVLTESGLVGIVRYTSRSKTHTAVLRAADKVLIVQNLCWADEVRAPEFPVLDSKVDVDPRAVKMAQQLVESLVDKFDPSQFVDTYAVNVAELIDARAAGATITPGDEEKGAAEVGDLLARLEASVGKPVKRAAKRAPAKAPAKRAAAAQRTRKTA